MSLHLVRDVIGQILQNQNGQYFYVCGTCFLEFLTLQTFISHQVIAHECKEPPNLLDDLVDTFPKSQDNDSHEKQEVAGKVMTEQKTKGKIKRNVITRQVSLFKPQRTQLVSPNIPQKICGKFIQNYEARSIIRDPAVEFQCRNCDEKFTSLENLDSHEVICALVPLRTICEYCHKTFDTGTLQQHIRRDHSSKFHHVCEVCHQGFIRPYDLVRHRRQHRMSP